VLLALAQPCSALRLTCATVGRYFPAQCCCKAAMARSCCAARAAPERAVDPALDRAAAPRACRCELELPAAPATTHDAPQRAQELAANAAQLAPVAHAAACFLPSLVLAARWTHGPPRPPDGAARDPLAPSFAFHALPCRAAGTIAELAVLGVARC
jgi:hypothetical protein